MWQNIAAASLESELPLPRSDPSTTSPLAGGEGPGGLVAVRGCVHARVQRPPFPRTAAGDLHQQPHQCPASSYRRRCGRARAASQSSNTPRMGP